MKAELHNVKEASIIFDGMAQLGEALAIVSFGLTGLRDSGIRGLVFSPLLYFCSYKYVFK